MQYYNLGTCKIDSRSNQLIGLLINGAERELHIKRNNYIAFLLLNNFNYNIFMTSVENNFTHKIYNQALDGLVPTIPSNALSIEINIIEEYNIGYSIKEYYDRTKHKSQ